MRSLTQEAVQMCRSTRSNLVEQMILELITTRGLPVSRQIYDMGLGLGRCEVEKDQTSLAQKMSSL